MQRSSSFRIFLLAGLVTLALGSSSHATAAPLCQSLFKGRTAEARLLSLDDAFKQWVKWEQTSNFERFRKPEEPLSVGALAIDRKQMTIDKIENLDPQLTKELRLDQGQILWLQHPYNTSPLVPFFDNTNHARSFTTYFTASRSMLLDGFDRAYTLKMPSDHPHGPHGEFQPTKAKTKDDIVTGLVRTRHIDNVDQAIGKDPHLIIAREVLSVADRVTGQGFLVRDISFMKDGYYYLPAFSLPYVGRDIAHLHGKDPNIFWQKHYAAALGRAKAKLLLRYGLQMETPNSQNILIQLDRNLLPTGRIVLRDMSDSFFVRPVAEALGYKKQMEHDLSIDYKAHEKLVPFWENSSWRMDEAGPLSFSKEILDTWGVAHDIAYKQTIESTIGVGSVNPNDNITRDIERTLFSEIGRRRLSRYQRDRMSRAERAKNLPQPRAGNG